MATKKGGKVNVKTNPTILTDTINVIKSKPINEEIIRTDVPENTSEMKLETVWSDTVIEDLDKQTMIDALPEDIIIPSTTIDNDVETSIETLPEVNDEPKNIGLEHLNSIREETTKRWEESGLLEGLNGDVKQNISNLFENQLAHIIKESEEKLEFDEQIMINSEIEKPINLILVEDVLLQPEIAVVPEKTKRSIESLSASELRFYQRTGILPE